VRIAYHWRDERAPPRHRTGGAGPDPSRSVRARSRGDGVLRSRPGRAVEDLAILEIGEDVGAPGGGIGEELTVAGIGVFGIAGLGGVRREDHVPAGEANGVDQGPERRAWSEIVVVLGL